MASLMFSSRPGSNIIMGTADERPFSLSLYDDLDKLTQTVVKLMTVCVTPQVKFLDSHPSRRLTAVAEKVREVFPHVNITVEEYPIMSLVLEISFSPQDQCLVLCMGGFSNKVPTEGRDLGEIVENLRVSESIPRIRFHDDPGSNIIPRIKEIFLARYPSIPMELVMDEGTA